MRITGSAGTIENISNHMEYSYCTNMFTNGQRDRMRVALESSISGRSNLWSTANLLATGVQNPTVCAPTPDFYSSATGICEGNTVTFYKNTSGTTTTSVRWTFEGGTPGTSTAPEPKVTYTTAGTYYVSMSAMNAFGIQTKTKAGYVTVRNLDPGQAPDTEAFENPQVLSNQWTATNYDGNANKWHWVENAGTNGSNALCMNA
ncbi:MAG: PKD domain-containing protein, partial [Bacteroidota bacterium]